MSDFDRAQLSDDDVTGMLKNWTDGDGESLKQLLPLVYDQLKQKARYQLGGESGQTLQPTALISEVYLRLKDGSNFRFNNRLQFFSFAGQLMHRILVEHARARGAQKRGGGWEGLSLDAEGGESLAVVSTDPETLLALNGALEKLQEVDERKAKIINLALFAGLRADEIAELLGVSTVTIRRDLRAARAWLSFELKGGQPED